MEQLNNENRLSFNIKLSNLFNDLKKYLLYSKKERKKNLDFHKIFVEESNKVKEPHDYFVSNVIYDKTVYRYRLEKKHYRFLVRYDKKILRKKIKESFKALFI
ncbi:hypothetical protein [Helcococcus ovis]|uniref:hypothetical protein n=1 Tax=Helcococcus ovis TaxID=72026 RepID=UPI00106F2728|nr:hypothetical protein [Helcococcus ovis]TFF67239.1 hypothetical protein EQF93_05640 [Helcococcus ovis]WNZ00539.1 hypothetical protein EQF90_004580 [Helcococcus ovis]